MKVALVHDYIKEYGGAERVLEALCEIWPDASIYTAFYDQKGTAYAHFKNKKIIPSWVQNIPFFASKLHSPLRFLAPLIWGSFKEELKKYDVIISSASWYITKGFGKRQKTNDQGPIEICYCHTPPRWLYGYATSVNFQKYPFVKIYAAIVGHFMRLYDFKQAQKPASPGQGGVDYFIANSEETAGRIKKFYRRDSTVIYPPVGFARGPVARFPPASAPSSRSVRAVGRLSSRTTPRNDYYLIVSRLVGGKGLEVAMDAAKKMGIKLKIAGETVGYYSEYKNYSNKYVNIQFLGRVSDAKLMDLYHGAKAFLALAKDEDFGITPVESMLCGTPVIAFRGGGYKETVLDKKTGLLFDDYSVDGLIKAIKQFNNLPANALHRQLQAGLAINPNDCIKQAKKFSKERFKIDLINLISNLPKK